MATDEFMQSLEELMADQRLVELCELQRTGDEVLDVVSLNENQHSDILAWMLDAREGHGQGDEILRDLLVCASTTAASPACSLDGKFKTAKFFKAWPPSRIRTTSFGAAFTARELGIERAERVDLFVIDAQNRFILIIENKAGTSHRDAQLDLYRESFGRLVADNPRLREYDHAFIALDRAFDIDAEEERPSSKNWLHLGYDWLETSATRALMHVRRGNAAAKLVVSYCNRQTSWEDPEGAKATDIAVALHQDYPDAVRQLIEFFGVRLEREWLRSKQDDAVLLFLLQNKSVVSLLRETRGMATVRAAIAAKLPTIPKDNVAHKRAWLNLCPRGWEAYRGDDWWPVYLEVRTVDEAKSKYTLALCWNANYAQTANVASELRARLALVDPRFDKYGESRWRRTVMVRAVSLPDLVKAVVEVERRLVEALSAKLSD